MYYYKVPPVMKFKSIPDCPIWYYEPTEEINKKQRSPFKKQENA